MNYAPILIPTLCRYEHFVRCIESLKKNGWAKYTDVYIALDYPKNESHKDGYYKILEYLEGDFNEFKSFNIVKRAYNYGSVRNMRELRELVLEKYDRFIRTDDDAEFSPNFLEYMDKCLEKYEYDEDVMAVCGYNYPIDLKLSSNSTVFKTNMTFRMWGTGFWRDKQEKMRTELTNNFVREYAKNNKINKAKMTKVSYIDILNGVTNFHDNLIDSFCDVSLAIYIQLIEKYVIVPTKSKVRNHGFDGSGIYCPKLNITNSDKITAKNFLYSNQDIDQQEVFDLVEDNIANEYTIEYFNDFDPRSKREIFKSEFKFYIMKVLGESLYKKLWIMRNK